MTNDEISVLCERLEGMFPTAKLSPSKLHKTWCASTVLQQFPVQRRADLLREISQKCGDFPNLPQVAAICRRLVPAEKQAVCQTCDGTGYVHYDAAGKDLTWEYTNASGQVLAYNGVPVLYHFAMPCEACKLADA